MDHFHDNNCWNQQVFSKGFQKIFIVHVGCQSNQTISWIELILKFMYFWCSFPPWHLPIPRTCLSLHLSNRGNLSTEVCQHRTVLIKHINRLEDAPTDAMCKTWFQHLTKWILKVRRQFLKMVAIDWFTKCVIIWIKNSKRKMHQTLYVKSDCTPTFDNVVFENGCQR